MQRWITALFLLACGAAHAQQAQQYTPDVAEFDGTNSMTFDPSPQLALADGGTIEFWVVPDWTDDPGYDPVIVCNAGQQGPSYLIAMLRDRDGIAVVAGEDEDVVTFDFTDGDLHHVAVSQFDDGLAVIIDGKVAGTSELAFQDLPSSGVWVGSIDGENNGFKGAIAGLRIWDAPVEQEVLVEYALKDIFAADHPYIDWLSAMSDFRAGELLLVEPSAAEAVGQAK